MSDVDVTIERAAIALIEASPELARLLASAADSIAAQARRNAAAHYPSSPLPAAISTTSGTDTTGPYADVGYTRSHPGFVLWWSEVGTRKMSPRPHLRAAVKQVHI